MIELGKRVRDISSGYEGTVVSKHDYISGVTEYGVRADSRDGTRPSVEWVEEALLEVVGDGITVKPVVRPAGFYSEAA